MASEATIKATGDILVFGRLYGEVFAGSDGNRESCVASLLMEPSCLSIANESVVVPKSEPALAYPEVAKISSKGYIEYISNEN